MIKKISFLFFIFLLAFFSCKNQICSEKDCDEDFPYPSEGSVSIQINVVDEVNADTFVKGTTLQILDAKTKALVFKTITDGSPFNFDLEINRHYDFELEGLKGKYASSAVRNLKIFPYTRKINIIQLEQKMPGRKLKAPVLSKFYFKNHSGEQTALTDGAFLSLPVDGDFHAEINSSGGAVMKIFNGSFGIKLGIDEVPSSIAHKNAPLLGGILPYENNPPQKNGEMWLNVFKFKIRNHGMGGKDKAYFVLVSYDAAGSRLEHHVHVNLNGSGYKKYPGGDISFQKISFKTKNHSSSINLFSNGAKTSYYLSVVSFQVIRNGLHFPINGADLFRRRTGAEEPFYKTASVVYDIVKVGNHVVAETFGGLDFSEDYEYKIRIYFEGGFYTDSPKIKVKLLPPFETALTFPENNKITAPPQEFSFVLSSPSELFYENLFDFFSFALMIKSWNGNRVFLASFKYYLDGKHEGDSQLEIAVRGLQKDFVSVAELKRMGRISNSKTVSDFIVIDKKNGKVTIGKSALSSDFNLINAGEFYKEGMTYYWDICSYEKNLSNLFFPCRFVKNFSSENIETEFSSYANTSILDSYTSNGCFSFSVDGNVPAGSGLISGSYIVKASDGFDFSFLKELGAEVTGTIKFDDDIDEAYFRIENKKGNGRDIFYELINTHGIISAERNYDVKFIEPVDGEDVLSGNKPIAPFAANVKPADEVIEQACYSLEITQANKAYEEFGFGNNEVFTAIIDTGINTSHEDFFDVSGKPIFINPDTSKSIVDNNGHGSHCAGIICAIGGNGKGIAGVAWKKTKIIPYQIEYFGPSGWDIYGALVHFTGYVKEQRSAGKINQATIPINMSLGSPFPSAFALEAVNKALQEGVLPIAAMGNEGAYFVNYPAAYSGVVAVGSSDGRDKVSQFSDKGRHVSLCAPGSGIVSTDFEKSDSYVSKSGTSMAAPFVTGAIAYLMSFNNSLQPGQVRTILEETADKIESTEEFNCERGFGRINVYKAVKRIKENLPNDKFFKGKVKINLKKAPNVNVPVILYGKNGICIAVAQTVADGTAEFSCLLPGDYVIKINNGKFFSKSFSVPAGNSADVVLEFDS